MELRQVEYFLAVVDHGGLGAAAAALSLSQPSLSQAIRQLEKDLGVQLFHRIGRGLVPTAAARALEGPARQVLRDVVAAEASLVDASGLPRGRLDVLAFQTLAVGVVPGLVARFRERYPNVTVRIGDLREEEAAAAKVREGHCEVVFSYLPVAGGGVSTVELGRHDWWLVFPPGTALPPTDPLPLSALPDLPLVIVPKGSTQRARIERALSAAGKRTRPSAIVHQREAALSLVFAGLGATVAERGMAERARRRGAEVRGISPAITSSYGIVYTPAGLTPAGEAFLEVAHEMTRSAGQSG